MTEPRFQQNERAISEIRQTEDSHTKAMADMKTKLEGMKITMDGMLKHLDYISQKGVVPTPPGVESSPSSSVATNPTTMRLSVQIDFPRFSGDDVEAWLFRCGHYFELDATPLDSRIDMAALHLDGDAFRWHICFIKMKESGHERLSWGEYSTAIKSRFGASTYDDPWLDLRNLRQTGSVDEYIRKFESLLLRVQLSDYVHERLALSFFLGGLDELLQIQLRMLRPKSLCDAYALAKLQESIEHMRGSYRPQFDDSNEESSDKLMVEAEEETPQISLHAISGGTPIKAVGYVGSRPIQILISSGSSHNFLDLQVAKKLTGCSNAVKLPGLTVTAANGQEIPAEYACKGFKWSLQGRDYAADVLLVALDNCYDLILGAEWLSQFGVITMNFQKLYLQFQDGNGEQCTIQGQTDSARSKLRAKGSQVASIHSLTVNK